MQYFLIHIAYQEGKYNILFYSILFYSILFYSILFYSIPFYSILFYSVLLTFTAIFLASFPATFIAFHKDPSVAGIFPVEVVPSPAGVPCLELAFRLLLGSLLLPTSLLLLVRHMLVPGCMAHSHFYDHQFSMDMT
jgi:hypothetical protein